jgi:hypothetical protein
VFSKRVNSLTLVVVDYNFGLDPGWLLASGKDQLVDEGEVENKKQKN